MLAAVRCSDCSSACAQEVEALIHGSDAAGRAGRDWRAAWAAGGTLQKGSGNPQGGKGFHTRGSPWGALCGRRQGDGGAPSMSPVCHGTQLLLRGCTLGKLLIEKTIQEPSSLSGDVKLSSNALPCPSRLCWGCARGAGRAFGCSHRSRARLHAGLPWQSLEHPGLSYPWPC